jgi:hypothetical protein
MNRWVRSLEFPRVPARERSMQHRCHDIVREGIALGEIEMQEGTGPLYGLFYLRVGRIIPGLEGERESLHDAARWFFLRGSYGMGEGPSLIGDQSSLPPDAPRLGWQELEDGTTVCNLAFGVPGWPWESAVRQDRAGMAQSRPRGG